MKLVCISDTHCALHEVKVPEGDVLVHAGDGTFRGTLQEVATWAKDLAALPHKHKIVIAGNHDWLFEKEPEIARNLMRENGITYLEDSGVEIEGVKFWGSPWQPEFCNWAFNLSRMGTELHDKWALIPEGTDVLITHGPPLDILDAVPRFQPRRNPLDPYGAYLDEKVGEEHVGCYDLKERVLKLKPKLHVFGHIHCAYGEMEFNGTRFVNAAVMDDMCYPINKPIVVEL